MNHLLNRNRCRQAVSEKETEGLVLNIYTANPPSCQQERRKDIYCFVNKCKELLAKEESWKIIFLKIESKSPTMESQI